MLRKRSRAVSSSKPVLMTDSTTTVPSPTPKHTMPITSFLFPTPRLFIGFSPKTSIDSSEAALSPTSILETKPLTLFGNPFFSDRKSITPPPTITTTAEIKHHPWDNGGSKPIGLGLVDVLNNESNDTNSSKPEKRMVLFGSKLRIQVPTIPFNSISPTGSVEFSHSPIEFGIKNRDSQLALYSPGRRSPSLGSEAMASSSHRIFTGCLSPREMELSEDYTCVIAHGPNPRTTHIFDNCIVESCGGHGFIGSRKESRFSSDPPQYPSDIFLSFCHACKKNLGQGKDIYMYRGEKAFCSKECRYQEMFFDEEGMEKCSAELQCPL